MSVALCIMCVKWPDYCRLQQVKTLCCKMMFADLSWRKKSFKNNNNIKITSWPQPSHSPFTGGSDSYLFYYFVKLHITMLLYIQLVKIEPPDFTSSPSFLPPSYMSGTVPNLSVWEITVLMGDEEEVPNVLIYTFASFLWDGTDELAQQCLPWGSSKRGGGARAAG